MTVAFLKLSVHGMESAVTAVHGTELCEGCTRHGLSATSAKVTTAGKANCMKGSQEHLEACKPHFEDSHSLSLENSPPPCCCLSVSLCLSLIRPEVSCSGTCFLPSERAKFLT